MSGAQLSLAISVFLACAVEAVEAFTIVLAVGTTRRWRAALAGVGAVAAAFTTFLAVRFLLRWFRTNRLTPFGIYCIVAGIVCSLIFAF